MKTAILGAGAMGSIFGAQLAEAGQDVVLVDVWRECVDNINRQGLRIRDREGQERTVAARASADPAAVGPADLVIVFTKCYHTEDAVRGAAALLGPDTAILSLQNGWGNAPRIASVVGEERVMAGVCYHSGTVLGPGHVYHAGLGPTFVGELDGRMSERLLRVEQLLNAAGIETTATPTVLREIWAKLCVNVCTLPISSLLRMNADEIRKHDGTLALMRELIRETVAVARAQGVEIDEEERWHTITVSLGKRAAGSKPSMLQDVEKSRRTEIDVISGAVVEAGRRFGVPTPHNQTLYWLVKSLEETFPAA